MGHTVGKGKESLEFEAQHCKKPLSNGFTTFTFTLLTLHPLTMQSFTVTKMSEPCMSTGQVFYVKVNRFPGFSDASL